MRTARILAGAVLSGLGLLVVLGAASPRGRSAPPPPPPPPQVELTLTAIAPDHGWTLKLTNTGTDPVRIVADPRLFSFDVTNAGHEQHCTLPSDMTPSTDTARTLVVPAGRSWSQRVEPLLYCFGAAQSAALAPGATVIASFGFPGARYAPPFAVTPTTLTDGGVGPARRISAPVVTLAAAQQPQDAGAALADAAPVTINPPDAYPVKLKTSLPARLDVSRAYEQTVTVTITNEGDRPVRTLMTPPVIGFLVERPDGTRVRCGADTTVTAFAELVSTLGPRGRSSQSIDIGAICGIFMRAPGLYRVRPRLDTRRVSPPPGSTTFWSGESIGQPMTMRVRNGDEPLPPPRLDRGP